ncbi:hypothetical protein H4582DRAFT_2074701 [Lactarius indigo]|nr:hypothetical protein H4582DRAFT_2074701 [Lactarius indigo]
MATPLCSRDSEAQTEARRRLFSDWSAVSGNDDGKTQAHEKRQSEAEDAEYGDSSAMYWNLYASEAEVGDQKLVETLTGDTNSMLLLGDSQQSSQFCPEPPSPGGPSPAVIRSNILLVLSFFLAMTSALACTLIQQWCREFTKYASPRVAPHKRGRVRTYLFQGLERFYIRRFMHGVHLLLHTSVFLFFCGVSDYLYDVYPTVGMISWYCVTALAVVYGALSIAPLIIGNCPYQTALTPPLQFGYRLLFFPGRVVWWCLRRSPKGRFPGRKDLHFNKSHFLVDEANKTWNAEHLDPCAMEWLFTDNDFSDTDMDRFLLGLPGYIHSDFTVAEALPKVLTAPYILRRTREHLLACASATELSEETRLKRVSACVESLWAIFQHQTNAEHPENLEEEEPLPEYMQSIVDGFNRCDKVVGLRGFCVRALAFQGFLTKFLEQAEDGLPNIKFPTHFIPLYMFFSSWDHTKRQDTVPPPDRDREMWRAVLHDDPLINLTLLARAILSQGDADSFDPLNVPSLALFNEVHKQTLTRVEDQADEPSLSLSPLLEALDAVAGGLRLCMVFRHHPRYPCKTDLIFGKDRLRNPDLFRVFASCLPEFVAKNPEKSVRLMEGLVCYDGLWTILQVHLRNCLQSNTSIPDKLRVFDRCCTVIDVAFALLDNSPNVDWRAPELGSLAHYFELFVTDCFEGVFIERSMAFRVGLIKARFCKAALAQFLDEFHRKGTVVFRSQWDVAFLARVFYSLGVGTDEDVEFWKSFVDGGPIGAEFMTKAHATLEMAARDGPLLNFCKLGHLGVMAVPFEGSSLQDIDFTKLLDLLQKLMEHPRLTLASAPVWKELRRLQLEIEDARSMGSDEDKTKMQALLVKIDAVYKLRLSSTQEHYPRDDVQSPSFRNSPVVQPNPPSTSPIPVYNRSSYASSSTTVAEDLRDSSLAQEDNYRGITPAPFNNSRGELANLYHNAYPLLPSQIGPGGTIIRPFFSPFLATLSPPLETGDRTTPGIPSIHPPPPYMRYNYQHRRAPVYYPPKAGAKRRSATLSLLQSSTRAASAPSRAPLVPSSGGDYSSTPPASPVDEIYTSSTTPPPFQGQLSLPTFVYNLHTCQDHIHTPGSPFVAVEAQLVSASSTVATAPGEKENAPTVSAIVTALAFAAVTAETNAEIDPVIKLHSS